VFLKTHRICKEGKAHIYYSLCESLRVSRKRVLQRRVLHLGELNTTQLERWQRTIEVVEEDGRRHQMRLFTNRHTEGKAAAAPEDVAEVLLSSLVVRRPRQFGACWVGCKLWEELELGEFWGQALGEQAGAVAWEKVVELLVVNRLIAPRSELSTLAGSLSRPWRSSRRSRMRSRISPRRTRKRIALSFCARAWLRAST
jgi:hypothetical protein